MAVIFSTTSSRTYLEAVQITLRSVGISPPGTIVGPDKNTALAMDAVANALDIVWNFTDWEFRREWGELELSALQMWYPVDERFAEILLAPQVKYGVPQLSYRKYEKLVEDQPGLRFVPADWQSSALATEMEELETYQGTPRKWTYAGGFIGLFPIPDSDFVSDCPVLVYAWAKTVPTLAGDNDLLEIDRILETAHQFLSSAGMKESLEYPDHQIDYQRGIDALKKAANRKLFKGARGFTTHPGDR